VEGTLTEYEAFCTEKGFKHVLVGLEEDEDEAKEKARDARYGYYDAKKGVFVPGSEPKKDQKLMRGRG